MHVVPRRPSFQCPYQWFTGDVSVDVVVQEDRASRILVSSVHCIRCCDVISTPRPDHWGEDATDAEDGTES